MDPSLPESISMETLGILYPAMRPSLRVLDLGPGQSDGRNRSAVFFSTKEEGEVFFKQIVSYCCEVIFLCILCSFCHHVHLFQSFDSVDAALKSNIVRDGINITIKQAYFVSFSM
jgi:hypothetical protein